MLLLEVKYIIYVALHRYICSKIHFTYYHITLNILYKKHCLHWKILSSSQWLGREGKYLRLP